MTCIQPNVLSAGWQRCSDVILTYGISQPLTLGREIHSENSPVTKLDNVTIICHCWIRDPQIIFDEVPEAPVTAEEARCANYTKQSCQCKDLRAVPFLSHKRCAGSRIIMTSDKKLILNSFLGW